MAAAVVVLAGLQGATASASPTAAAPVATPRPPATTTEYDRGTLDTTEVVLSRPDAPAGRAGSDATPGASAAPAPGAEGWTTTHELDPGTEMVALSWDGPASAAAGAAPGTVAVRSHDAAGWSDWTEVTADPADQGGEGDGRVGTELIWLGSEGADRLEVRVVQGPLVALELLAMRYHEGEARTVTVPAATTASNGVSMPTIRPRSDWTTGGWKSGNSGCGNGPTVAPALKFVVVHHTASTNAYTAAQVPGLIAGVYQYHTSSLGWCDIAYNFLVDKFGTIWQGRSGDITKPVVGGHAMGFNTGSVGVSLLGQFEPGASPAAAEPTTAMMDSAARLIAWKLSLAGLSPTAQVTVTSGGSTRYAAGTSVTLPIINYHQQTSTTACPGAYVISRMDALRSSVASIMGGAPPSNPDPPTNPPTNPPVTSWAPFATVQDLVWRQYVDFQRDPGTYTDRKWWADNLSAGNTNRNALVASLVRSSAVDARAAAPIRLYLAYFGRIPDSAGIRYWWGEMDRGKSIRAVSQLFSGTPEFKNKYGPLDDTAFVRLVYRNVMGREGEPAGISYWVGELRAGRENRGGVMAKFTESPEYKTTKRTIIDVMLVHEAMLARAISPQSHLEWVARVERDGLGALIGTIYSSPEYASRVG